MGNNNCTRQRLSLATTGQSVRIITRSCHHSLLFFFSCDVKPSEAYREENRSLVAGVYLDGVQCLFGRNCFDVGFFFFLPLLHGFAIEPWMGNSFNVAVSHQRHNSEVLEELLRLHLLMDFSGYLWVLVIYHFDASYIFVSHHDNNSLFAYFSTSTYIYSVSTLFPSPLSFLHPCIHPPPIHPSNLILSI